MKSIRTICGLLAISLATLAFLRAVHMLSPALLQIIGSTALFGLGLSVLPKSEKS